MPSSSTFQMKPVGELLGNYIYEDSIVIDPFNKDSYWSTYSNDLNPESSATYHMDARDFLDMLIEKNIKADIVLLDPPYSPRQISECYKKIGLKVSSTDTQNAKLYKECKDKLMKLLKKDGIAITFGWNSNGFGKNRGFEMQEILLVQHGAAHNDTIVTVEKRINE